MNETEFVHYLEKHFPFSRNRGIGDDASVVKNGDHFQLITTDMLIEDTHFRLQDISMEDLAAKALAVNQSDIAAMGGEPEYFYLCLGFPGKLDAGDLKKFFRGLENACLKSGLELAGGDFSHSPCLIISITMVGKTRHPVYRHTAKPGDLIGLTGPTGASALGLALLQRGKIIEPWIKAHTRVIPQVREGQILSRYAQAMIDVSDGLVMDLKRILKASGTGAILEYDKIPVSPEFKQTCLDYGIDEMETVLAGGEDYVLLFTITPEKELELRKGDLYYYLVGRVNLQKDKLDVTNRGLPVRLKNNGYDHFKHR
jgi:thiamine-monophosphate kinase